MTRPAGTASVPAAVAQRYRKLVLQLGDELGNRHGWKSSVARRLGVHPSYISKMVAGKIGDVGGDVIAKAMEALGVDASFFYEAPQTSPGPVTSEGASMLAIEATMAALDDAARARVAAWVAARWGQ